LSAISISKNPTSQSKIRVIMASNKFEFHK
jgi:hypothetical protein